MSAMQRTKGAAFERKIAAELRAAFPSATVRRSSQADQAYEPDVVCEGDGPPVLKRLWLELTDGRHPDPRAKLRQAAADAPPDRWPIAVWHKLGERTSYATTQLWIFRRLLGDEHSVNATLDIIAHVTVAWTDFLAVLKCSPVGLEMGKRVAIPPDNLVVGLDVAVAKGNA